MDEVAGIYARESPFLDRYVQLGIAQGRILSVEFPHEPDENATGEHDLLDRIDGYLQGTEDDFSDVTVAMTMPTEEGEVLEKVREVPYGEDARVEQIAMMVPGRNPEDSEDLTAIREALASNPAPLFIPTHRVTDGPGGLPAAIEQKLRSVEGLA